MPTITRTLLLFALIPTIFGQNQVLFLDGIDDYIQLPNAIIDTDKFTIEAWVKMNGPGGGIETQSVIFEQRDDVTGCNHSAVIFTSESRSYNQFQTLALRTDQECVSTCITASASYGEWNHYAGVVSSNVAKIYRNGQLLDVIDYDHVGSFATNIHHISLGKHTHDNAGFGFLNGTLDEIRIWGTPLNQYEIITMMNTEHLSGEETDLLAYWSFDDGLATDITGHGNDGMMMSSASTIEESIPRPCNGLLGDINEDQHVTVADIILLVHYVLGGFNPNIPQECLDFNADGQVDVIDVMILSEHILNGS